MFECPDMNKQGMFKEQNTACGWYENSQEKCAQNEISQ